jgi:hypothetical protein
MTRVFTVEVTGCKNCPSANPNAHCCTKNPAIDHESYVAAYRIYQQNKDQLTPSCPMWDKTKESEIK